MTTRYEIRLSPNLKHLDIHIQGVPSSAGYEARVPVREGREHHCREFAEHLVNLLNADVIEQARRANGAEALRGYAERTGLSALDKGLAQPAACAADAWHDYAMRSSQQELAAERWQQC